MGQLARVVGTLAALAALVAGCGDDEPEQVQATTPPAITEPAQTTPAAPQTATTEELPPAATATTPTTEAPPLETERGEVLEQSRERASEAKRAGARSCPPIGEDGVGVVDITAKGVSCSAARRIISSTTTQGKRGFACDITSESFADVPTVAFSCKRESDGAEIGYTAVG